MDEHRAANRSNWDDRVAIHWQADGYDAPGFIADPTAISDVVRFDRAYLGDVTGRTLLHLQCHFGKDTLSWARLGAVVTGIDFSEAAIAAARRLSAESGTPGRFEVAELYATPEVLAGEQFDIVYTGVGAINWLPDIAAWGRVVAAMLAPGGVFLIRDAHPVLRSLDWPEDGSERLELRFDYFETAEPVPWDDASTYSGSGTVSHTRTYEWNHGIAETMDALLGAGLVIDRFEEHRALEWQGHPAMVRDDDGMYRFPPHLRDKVPLMMLIQAHRPG